MLKRIAKEAVIADPLREQPTIGGRLIMPVGRRESPSMTRPTFSKRCDSFRSSAIAEAGLANRPA